MPTRSEAQIAASRANGAKSKGPITPEGKRICAMNALKHGGAAECVVLKCEIKAHFDELQESFFAEFRPRTPVEVALVESMAVARWRWNRQVVNQKIALERDIDMMPSSLGTEPMRAVLALTSPGPHTSGPEGHDRLLRYELAHDRQFHRALKQLLALQARNARDPELAGSDEPYVPVAPSVPNYRQPDPDEPVIEDAPPDPAPNPGKDPEQILTEQTQDALSAEAPEAAQRLDLIDLPVQPLTSSAGLESREATATPARFQLAGMAESPWALPPRGDLGARGVS